MTMFLAHLSDSGDGIIDTQVLDNGRQHHSSPASAPGAVNQTVPALREVVDQVQDVVHKITLGTRRIIRRKKLALAQNSIFRIQLIRAKY